jgi:SAM-dependent methyltransferase
MTQNVYDEPEFFEAYSQMDRSVHGPEVGMEWPRLRSLFPDFRGKRVLDLGCGFGGLCRYVSEQGAAHVVGIDSSERMLEDARARTSQENVTYQLASMTDFQFEAGSFDVALSTLALHYVERVEPLFHKVADVLVPGGSFVMSFEHPMFTARADQAWCERDGERLHWPVDGYQDEGPRRTNFMGGDVLKHHRTVGTYVNALIDTGFRIQRVIEPGPTQGQLSERPEWADEARRPIFMLIGAVREK